jgi:uncharacterized protein YbjT (DUF2867 family)
MKIVVVGGTGLIGRKLIAKLRESGHDAVAAALETGIDTLTGAGLAEAFAGAQVVVDVSNSPSFEDEAVLRFFMTSTRNILSAELAAGVKHHVALSIVGAERVQDSGYMRAKVAQEKLIAADKVPYTILRATQFFEFVGRIADASTDGDTVHLTPAMMQPVAAEDVASALASVAVAAPINGMLELAGPDPIRMVELARGLLTAKHDKRRVVTDDQAPYFGAILNDSSLTPGKHARLGQIHFADWLTTAVEGGRSPTAKR